MSSAATNGVTTPFLLVISHCSLMCLRYICVCGFLSVLMGCLRATAWLFQGQWEDCCVGYSVLYCWTISAFELANEGSALIYVNSCCIAVCVFVCVCCVFVCLR